MKTPANGFIRLERQLWQSDQWRTLSVNAQVVIIDIWAWFNGHNNGEISYSLRDAMARLRCSRSTAQRALAELQNAHLIEAVIKGSFDHKNGARKGMATKWRLTFLPTTKKGEFDEQATRKQTE